jgi:hypothetical protein
MGVLGINHLAFRTPDPDRLRRFYLALTGAEQLEGEHRRSGSARRWLLSFRRSRLARLPTRMRSHSTSMARASLMCLIARAASDARFEARSSTRLRPGASTSATLTDAASNSRTTTASAHRCQPLNNFPNSANNLSLTWSTALNRWLGVFQNVAGGYWFTTSPDLTTWTKPQKFLDRPNPWAVKCGDANEALYASVLDPSSKSPNFTTTGSSPYFYFSQFDLSWPSCDRRVFGDIRLVRIPLSVRYSKVALPVLGLSVLSAARRGEASTSQGHPRTIFRRALERDNLVLAEVGRPLQAAALPGARLSSFLDRRRAGREINRRAVQRSVDRERHYKQPVRIAGIGRVEPTLHEYRDVLPGKNGRADHRVAGSRDRGTAGNRRDEAARRAETVRR